MSIPIPEWVNALDKQDTDKELLLQLCEAGTLQLDTPRTIVFAIKDIPDKKAAKSAATKLKGSGWNPTISLDAINHQTYWIEAIQQNYRITKDQLETDEAYFIDIADMHHALYDGWYTEVK